MAQSTTDNATTRFPEYLDSTRLISYALFLLTYTCLSTTRSLHRSLGLAVSGDERHVPLKEWSHRVSSNVSLVICLDSYDTLSEILKGFCYELFE